MQQHFQSAALALARVKRERAHSAWATRFEAGAIAARVRAGRAPLCAHNYVTAAVNRDRALVNNEVQASGKAACIAAQLAALAADPAKAKGPAHNGLVDA